jgi:hypothetical protein
MTREGYDKAIADIEQEIRQRGEGQQGYTLNLFLRSGAELRDAAVWQPLADVLPVTIKGRKTYVTIGEIEFMAVHSD